MSFVHCHVHSVYSLLDGYCKIPDLVNKVKELGQTSVALTDHNILGGCYTFKQECEKQGIKPLLGAEGYYTPLMSEMMKPVAQRNHEAEEAAIKSGAYTQDKLFKLKKEELKKIHQKYGYDMDDFHILFIAKSQKGWHNLVKIQSESARLCTFNGRYHCDMNLLEKYHEDIICSTACFPKDAMIETVTGYKEIQNVQINDYVVSHTGNLRKVTDVLTREYNGQMTEIICRYMKLPLNSTSDHKYFVLKKEEKDSYTQRNFNARYAPRVNSKVMDKRFRKTCRHFHGDWIAASELRPGDMILTPLFNNGIVVNKLNFKDCRHANTAKSTKLIHLKRYKINITEEFMWILGVFAAEGHWTIDYKKSNYHVEFTLHVKEKHIYNKLIDIINNIFGIQGHITKKGITQGVDIRFNSIELAKVFAKLFPDKGCYNKQLPWFIKYTSPAMQMAFLKGAWQGDGCYREHSINGYKTKELVYTTTSEKLCLGLQRILLQNFITPSTRYTGSKVGKHDNILRQEIFNLDVYGHDANLLFDYIYKDIPFIPNTDNLYAKDIPIDVDGNYYISYPIEKVISYTEKSTVYCLNVEKDHSFTVDNIAVHNCIGSYPAQQLKNKRPDLTDEYLDNMLQIFGKDFYLEIQPLNQELQRETNLHYMKWAANHDVKFIATNDSHWVNQVDAADHDILLCIGTGAKYSDQNRMKYWPEFWIRSEEEMLEAFEKQTNEAVNRKEITEADINDYQAFYEKAMKNTQELADMVDDNIKLGSSKPLFPVYKVDEGETPESVLTKKAKKGLAGYLVKHPECDRFKYAARLKEELDVINSKGFAPYMLTVYEYINWCDENGIATGPGRGSAAGSLVLFSIGITKNIDPIKDKLLFGRFLTKDRKDLPD